MKLDPTVKRILSMPNIDNFSAVEIRTAYLVLNNDQSLDPSDVRRFIYSEFVKLVNKGWLKKTISQKKGITRYTRTELFDSNALKVSETHNEPNSRQEDRKKQLLDRLFKWVRQLKQERNGGNDQTLAVIFHQR